MASEACSRNSTPAFPRLCRGRLFALSIVMVLKLPVGIESCGIVASRASPLLRVAHSSFSRS